MASLDGQAENWLFNFKACVSPLMLSRRINQAMYNVMSAMLCETGTITPNHKLR